MSSNNFFKKNCSKVCQVKNKAYLCNRNRETNGGLNKKLDSRADDLVAQLVEQMTLNHWVEGSSPSQVTPRKGGRVVDYSGLENRRAERHRGFESLSLRQESCKSKGLQDFFLLCF